MRPAGDHGACAVLHHPLLRAAASHEPPPARRRVRHDHVEPGLLGPLERDHGGDVGRRGAPHGKISDIRQRPRQPEVAPDRHRVLVAELAVEVRDPDHDVHDLAQGQRPGVAPSHERPDQTPALVGDIGRHQLHLPGRQLDAAEHHRLVEQRGRRHDAVAVHHHRGGAQAGIDVRRR